jgi:hypothetical protein
MRTAGWWKRNLEFDLSEVSTVEAKTPWHGLSNRVEFSYRGRRYVVGDMLLHGEALEIAEELSRATRLPNAPQPAP